MSITIHSIEQSPFLTRRGGALWQRLQMRVSRDGAAEGARALLDGLPVWEGTLSPGEQLLTLEIPEPTRACRARFALTCGDESAALDADLRVPKHWQVHIVQLSHHDPGYTDLPSHVLAESARWIEGALDDMRAFDEYPDDARPRFVIEQAWSLFEFWKRADAERRRQLTERVRRGDIEITALFGNLITELLGHEQCVRALYPAQALAREAGVTLVSAEHNDIPGFAWGLCRALCDAGMKLLCPGLPHYYHWGNTGLSSFWDERAIFPHKGPGAFWWQAPDGKRLLFWCNNAGCGGSADPRMPELAPRLAELEADGWPHEVLRWPVNGASRDNSPYHFEYCETVRAWNERYAYPRLIMSTNARFYEAFTDKLCVELPVHRGEVAGQDYPIGAMSLAASTTAAREAHALLRAAELLSTAAMDDAELRDPRARIEAAYRDSLFADEHAFGYHFPASPAQRASYWERGAYAMRACADAHGVLSKAMASVADRVASPPGTLRLVVFNASGLAGDKAVEAPLRDMDGAGSEIRPGNADARVLRGYLLNNRMNATPQGGFLDGRFRLVDTAAQTEVPYELDRIAFNDPDPYAAERAGLAAGGKRLGVFEMPAGIALVIRFVARDMPAYGYRSYELVPDDRMRAHTPAELPGDAIENEYYRVAADARGIRILEDARDGASLLDAECPHRLGELLLRDERTGELTAMRATGVRARGSAVCATLDSAGELRGVYDLRVRVRLYRGINLVRMSVRLLKNAEPLQGVYLPFPFAGDGIRYQGVLGELAPVRDYLPGSHADHIAVQDWAEARGSGILWHSRHAPMVSFSKLWPGYISPAHRCVGALSPREPQREADFDRAWIYSALAQNNFGTNFYVSQVADCLYEYSFARVDARGDGERALWGADAALPPQTILTERSRGDLPSVGVLLRAPGAHVLTLKRAEHGAGVVCRLWNHEPRDVRVRIDLPGYEGHAYFLCDGLERVLEPLEAAEVVIPASQVVTVLIQ